MRLYFYSAHNGRLSVELAEARETKSCYISNGGRFPNCLRRMPKDYISRIYDGYIVLTARNDEVAREMFREWFGSELRLAQRDVKSAETKLANLTLPVEE